MIGIPFSQRHIDSCLSKTSKRLATMLDISKKLDTKTRPISITEPKALLAKANEAISVSRSKKTHRLKISDVSARAFHVVEKSLALPLDELRSTHGCDNPRIGIMGELGGFWHLDKINQWEKTPIDGDWIAQPCNKCSTCIAKQSHAMSCLGELEATCWPQTHLLTRTFASNLHQDVSACLRANVLFRKSFGIELKRRGIPFKIATAHEYGAEKQRRHFHDNLYGPSIEQIQEIFGGPCFSDFRNEEGLQIFPDKHWVFGFVNIVPIQDPTHAGYAAKYAYKSKALAYAPELGRERDLLKKADQPILSQYFQFPRPAIGKQGLIKLAIEQSERIIDEMNSDPVLATLSDDPRGLLLPAKAGSIRNKPRPCALRAQDRPVVADAISKIYGRKLTFSQIFNDANQHDAVSEKLGFKETAWHVT